MASFRNIIVSFSYRQGASVLPHFFQILNESLSYTKYLFVCLGTTLLCVITQRGVVISTDVSGQPIGTIFKVQVFFL